jgi:hypothetical protein
MTNVIYGAAGAATGVSAIVSIEAMLLPTALTATTRKVRETPVV